MIDLEGLPAAERIRRGLAHVAAARATSDALLVAVAAQRLTAAGLPVSVPATFPEEREIALYHRLAETEPDPYSAYNAALAELDSFLSALEARRARVSRG